MNNIRPNYYKSFRSRSKTEFENFSLSLNELIDKKEKIILDIGFGTGDSSIEIQRLNPDKVIFGIEAYKPGIAKLATNKIHFFYGDAVELIENTKSSSIEMIFMLFPDPWPKKKHRKRRLMNEYTFRELERILVPSGKLHFCTDNINYAFSTLEMIKDITKSKLSFSKNRQSRPITKYEQKANKKNNFIFDIVFYKK